MVELKQPNNETWVLWSPGSLEEEPAKGSESANALKDSW